VHRTVLIVAPAPGIVKYLSALCFCCPRCAVRNVQCNNLCPFPGDQPSILCEFA